MFELEAFVKTIGYLGLFGIVFAESGVFLGFFLPGDSLLFTAGYLAAQGFFDIRFLIFIVVLGAVLGDNFGYAFGRRVGPKIFTRGDSAFFHKDHIARAERFYEAHGKKTIILARFFPIIRTFAPIVAGVGRMQYSVFVLYNILGGALWGIGIPLVGYYLGNVFPDGERYVLLVVAVIIITSLVPLFVLHRRRKRRGKRHVSDET